jgi:branched-chain amino acid transport system ATP-binding protein
MTNPILSLNNLRAGYGQTEILHDLSMHVNPNEIVAVIGPNGAGKSTAIKSVLGLLNISEGEVQLHGKNITNTPAAKVVELGISYVPQTNNVFVNLSVEENLEMGAWTRPVGIPERLDEMYALFPDLAEKRNQTAGSLSGGQRQMLAMAKALMVDARILLLDEPILIVEQNAKQALAVSDRGYVLVDGANRHTGKGSDLLADREIARMFLGGGH